MNISSHVFFPSRWKDGQCNFDGSYRAGSGKSLTHWFPLSTIGYTLYYIDKDAESIYGPTYGRYPSQSSSGNIVLHQGILNNNYCIFDSYSIVVPSKPFTYILY